MYLKVDNLKKEINNNTILNSISFNLQSGNLGIFIGQSGAGKSTLLKILAGLDPQYTGNIEINNISLNQSKNKIGLVFQDFNLFSNYTVIENITLPLRIIQKKTKSEADQTATKILEEYGLLSFAIKTTKDLSGGQKQRLAIARTIAMQPRIICFDEPFSALDPYLTKYIVNKIKELQKEGYIIVLTTHNVSILNFFDGNLYFLEKGIIREQANINTFYKNKAMYPYIFNFIEGIDKNE